MRERFELGRDVHQNVRALRVALGSVKRELSREDLAEMIRSQHGQREIGKSTIERWETDVEPDIQSIRIMALLAGCTFEEFALGQPPQVSTRYDPEMTHQKSAATLRKAANDSGGPVASRDTSAAARPPSRPPRGGSR